MAVFAKTEIDVLRESIRKATLIPTEDPTTLDAIDQASVTDSTVSRRDQMKLAIKIWTAVGKFIRSQCNKGRVIDSLCFGTFAKASTIGVTGADADNYYVYCTGPNSAFTMTENLQNVADIAQSILEEKLVQLNFNSIAAVCRCTPDSVKSLLSAVKTDVVDFVHVRGLTLNLNFMVGSLTLTQQGSVEFKSAQALDQVSNFSSMLPADMRSRAGEGTDRGLRAMQVDQQSTGGRSANLSNASSGQRKIGNSAFVNKKRWVRDPQSASQENGEEYGHLSQFLQEQIVSRKQRSNAGSSRGSRRSTNNNAIIEQAAKIRHDLKAVQDLADTHKAGHHIEKVPVAHLKTKVAQSAEDAIPCEQDYNEKEKSQADSGRYSLSNVRVSSRQRGQGARNAISQTREQLENAAAGVKDWQTMSKTHIHKPQYTSPGVGHLRHRTVDQGNRTPVVQTSRLMPATMDVDLDFNRDGITNERALYRHSDSKLNNIISRALNRKNVSYAFHTGYPLMMNAQGPYAVYSHMKRQGEGAYQGERKTRKAAYNRFEDDLRNLQGEREAQRDQFFGNIREEQMLVAAQRQFQLQTNKQNQEYILRQIDEAQENRRRMREEEIAYKKPHFGPEETHDVIEDLTYEDRLKKHTVLNNLKAQIKHREESREANDKAERVADRENLDRFIAVQNAEMQAQREKIMNDKRKLKKAWEKQAAMRNDYESRDNLFK